jgi:hypothetical protein
MDHRTLLLPLLAFSMHVEAQLAPGATAPLSDHLVEVNAQWVVQGHLTMAQGAPAHFADESQRIATHLHGVSRHLAALLPEGLGPEPLKQRLSLLEELDRYADAGRFPRNHVLPQRNPVFIDPYGTPCAVGHLMIASGHADLAQRIDGEMELAYVLDMEWPEIAEWASAHGFTVPELAWIQPGYPPEPLPFTPIGGGTNGPVKVVVEIPNGDLLLGGSFSEAGGQSAQQVVRWNGVSYVSMGAGLGGEVTCAAVLGNDLYVGGWQLDGVSDLARWDGSSWTFSTVFQGKSPRIHALHVHNGVLYAAGEEVGFAGVSDRVKRLSGVDWVDVGSALNGGVLALGSHNGVLVAAGAFTALEGAAMPAVLHVAELEGNEWGQLADGLNNTVRVLRNINGTLYAGGDLYANILPTFGAARIVAGGPSWELLLPDHQYYIPEDGQPAYIDAIAMHGNELYLGGRFQVMQILIYGNNLARLDAIGQPTPLAVLDGPVYQLLVRDDRLVMAGAFTANMGQALPHIAELDLVTGVPQAPVMGRLELFPMPATDELFVQAQEADLAKAAVGVLDAAGRRMNVPVQRQGDRLRLDVSGLASGSYSIRAASGERAWTATFVKP